MMFKYFSHSDFATATPECSIGDMDKAFLHKLDTARGIAGVPFVINSAYRTKEYEKSKGRDGTSSHIKGLAVDISANGSRKKFLIIDALLKTGFTRIGIGSDFVHVDDDPDKDQQVIWTY